MQLGELEKINKHFWEEFISSFGVNYCPESKEDIVHIYLMQFSANDQYLFVLNRGLYAWIYETEHWEIINFVDLKGINFQKDFNTQAGGKDDEGDLGVI